MEFRLRGIRLHMQSGIVMSLSQGLSTTVHAETQVG
jgi:hypothetical protein